MDYTIKTNYSEIQISGSIENACDGDRETPAYEGDFVIEDAIEYDGEESTDRLLDLKKIEAIINEDLSAETRYIDEELIYSNHFLAFEYKENDYSVKVADGEIKFISMKYGTGSVHLPLEIISKEFINLIKKLI